MPYFIRGKCIYKKDTGKKVGCTKGSVKKYLTALRINADESEEPESKLKTFKKFYKENIPTMSPGLNTPCTDYNTGVNEGEYAQDSGDQMDLNDANDPKEIIKNIIADLEDLKTKDWSKPLDNDLIKAMAQSLRDAGVEPTDFDAAVDASPEKQEQYLIYGPSSWKGGNGALNDLKAILAGNEPEPIDEEEANPASSLPYGSTSAGAADPTTVTESFYQIDEFWIDMPGGGRKRYHGIDKIEAKSEDDALSKLLYRISLAKAPNIPIGVMFHSVKKNGVKIHKLEDLPVKQHHYWWQDKD